MLKAFGYFNAKWRQCSKNSKLDKMKIWFKLKKHYKNIILATEE